MKLSKQDSLRHGEAESLLSLTRPLSDEERLFCFQHWNPGACSDVTRGGQFFTPVEHAEGVAVFSSGPTGRAVDLCAGIGVLAWHLLDHDRHNGTITKMACVEQNADFVTVGRRLVPEAEWIKADAFDRSVVTSLGLFSVGVSNPPFGKVRTVACDWTAYRGLAHLAACEILLRLCRSGGTVIVPDSDQLYPALSRGGPPSAAYQRWAEALPGASIGANSVEPFSGFKATGIKVANCNLIGGDPGNLYFGVFPEH